MSINSICICGGGSLGLVCAGVFLSKGIKVNILTGHPGNWCKNIKVIDDKGKIYEGILNNVSSDPSQVIPSSNLILLTQPGFLIEDTLKKIKPFLNNSAVIGSIVSSTGFFFFAHEILGTKHPIFGFQRVPFIARQKEYGKIGELLGYKPSLNVAIENCRNVQEMTKDLEYLFETPINTLNSFYEAALTNSNPILHTGRLYSLWRNYTDETYDNPILFYKEWTDEASDYLIKMDNEFQKLLLKLGLSKGTIPTLLDYYESTDASSLTKKIASIPAFQNILSPMKRTRRGWIPDFSSRYFTEDFPYGLKFIRDLAQKYNVETPYIDEVYQWGISKIESNTTGKL